MPRPGSIRRSPSALVGAALAGLIACAAAFAPGVCRLLSPGHRDPEAADVEHGLGPLGEPLPPSREHPLGSDMLGRDELARVVYGARVSLLIGLLATAASLGIGLAVGVAAGTGGGWTDAALMRLTDVLLAFPFLLLCIALAAIWGAGLRGTIAALALVSWAPLARVVRAKALVVRGLPYVEAARALGASPARVLARHVLPAVWAPAAALATLGMASMILAEATLSFLGLGLPPPTPAWGSMLAAAAPYLRAAPWLVAAPAVALLATVLAFQLLGNALRDALEPGARSLRNV